MNFIRTEIKGGICTLWLNHPPVNVITIALMNEITDACSAIQSNSAVQLLILRGAGKCFSAGMDVTEHLPDQAHAMIDAMHKMMKCIAELEIVTMSVLHVSAFGGGLELAMICDFAYATAGCKLGVPEIKLGAFPPVAVVLLQDLIGVKRANDLILTGRTISANEAHQMGLLNGVFADEKEIQIKADELMNKSRATLAITKRAMRKIHSGFFEKLEVVEDIYLNELTKTKDASEGLKAFLQKRPPNWSHD